MPIITLCVWQSKIFHDNNLYNAWINTKLWKEFIQPTLFGRKAAISPPTQEKLKGWSFLHPSFYKVIHLHKSGNFKCSHPWPVQLKNILFFRNFLISFTLLETWKENRFGFTFIWTWDCWRKQILGIDWWRVLLDNVKLHSSFQNKIMAFKPIIWKYPQVY